MVTFNPGSRAVGRIHPQAAAGDTVCIEIDPFNDSVVPADVMKYRASGHAVPLQGAASPGPVYHVVRTTKRYSASTWHKASDRIGEVVSRVGT